MTLDEAVELAPTLDWAAGEGWPMGYDAARIRRETAEILGVIAGAEHGLAERARPGGARGLVARLQAPSLRATVKPSVRRIESVDTGGRTWATAWGGWRCTWGSTQGLTALSRLCVPEVVSWTGAIRRRSRWSAAAHVGGSTPTR